MIRIVNESYDGLSILPLRKLHTSKGGRTPKESIARRLEAASRLHWISYTIMMRDYADGGDSEKIYHDEFVAASKIIGVPYNKLYLTDEYRLVEEGFDIGLLRVGDNAVSLGDGYNIELGDLGNGLVGLEEDGYFSIISAKKYSVEELTDMLSK